MPANFMNDTAVMSGTDIHKATFVSPTSPVSGVEFSWPYSVTVVFSSSDGDDGKRTGTVTADGSKMIREGFSIANVPHVPMMGPLHPLKEPTQAAKLVKDSFTRPFLTIMSVTSQGDPLAICMKGAEGYNNDCNFEGTPVPTGKVLCVCSVRTQPTGKDIVFRIFDEYIKKWLAEKIVSLVDIVMKALKPKVVPEIIWKIPRAIVSWIAKKVVPKLIDKAERAAKRAIDRGDRAHRGAPSL